MKKGSIITQQKDRPFVRLAPLASRLVRLQREFVALTQQTEQPSLEALDLLVDHFQGHQRLKRALSVLQRQIEQQQTEIRIRERQRVSLEQDLLDLQREQTSLQERIAERAVWLEEQQSSTRLRLDARGRLAELRDVLSRDDAIERDDTIGKLRQRISLLQEVLVCSTDVTALKKISRARATLSWIVKEAGRLALNKRYRANKIARSLLVASNPVAGVEPKTGARQQLTQLREKAAEQWRALTWEEATANETLAASVGIVAEVQWHRGQAAAEAIWTRVMAGKSSTGHSPPILSPARPDSELSAALVSCELFGQISRRAWLRGEQEGERLFQRLIIAGQDHHA